MALVVYTDTLVLAQSVSCPDIDKRCECVDGRSLISSNDQ